jgi:hypothetical protein
MWGEGHHPPRRTRPRTAARVHHPPPPSSPGQDRTETNPVAGQPRRSRRTRRPRRSRRPPQNRRPRHARQTIARGYHLIGKRRHAANINLDCERPIYGGSVSCGIPPQESCGRLWAKPSPALASSDVRSPGKTEDRPPIFRSLRNAELPRQPLRVGHRVLAAAALTDVGGHPAIARGTIRQKGNELHVLVRRSGRNRRPSRGTYSS